MKRKRIILIVITFVILFVENVVAETAPRLKTIDWSGKQLGKKIPQWIYVDDEKVVKQELGLPNSSKVFIGWGEQKKLEDGVILSKIECFEEIMKNAIMIEMAGNYSPDQFESNRILNTQKYYKLLSIRTPFLLIEETTTPEGYSIDKISYTPFGYHQLSIENGQLASEFITAEVLIPTELDKDEWKNFCGWFCDSQNVRVEQFWVKMKDSVMGIYYRAVTALSIEETKWNQMTQDIAEYIKAEDARAENLRELLLHDIIEN